MARPMKYTKEQIGAALRDAQGFVTTAARLLKCDPATVHRYIKRYPALAQVCADQREGMLDRAELELYKKITSGDLTALIFYLKTQGKGRGYTERIELDVPLPLITQLVAALRGASLEPSAVFEEMIRKAQAVKRVG